jgi:methylated-DNA-[protein]-cysteine S-methyltransferase
MRQNESPLHSPMELKWTEIESPVGSLSICRTLRGIARIDFGSSQQRDTALFKWGHKWWPQAGFVRDDHDELLKEAAGQLDEYFRGNTTTFNLPLDMKGTPFQLKVWQALLQVPYGQTAAYRDIAIAVGEPKAARAVGGANNKNPVPIIVPCHRVVGANGSMVGYSPGLSIKETLLRLERAPLLNKYA